MKQYLLRIVLAGLFWLTACQVAAEDPAPQAPTAATRIATTGADAWTYVALGSSHSWGWISHYAAHIEADLGVAVTVYDESQAGQDALGVVAMLASRPQVVERLERADVVTIVALGEPARGQCVNGRGDYLIGDKPLEKTVAAYRANYAAMIEAILAHVDPSTTLVRAQDVYNPYVERWQAAGRFDDCNAAIDALTSEMRAVYGEYGIPVVAVRAALNGPDGRLDPGASGYLRSDGIHLNDVGGKVVADLMREAGYGYAAP